MKIPTINDYKQSLKDVSYLTDNEINEIFDGYMINILYYDFIVDVFSTLNLL